MIQVGELVAAHMEERDTLYMCRNILGLERGGFMEWLIVNDHLRELVSERERKDKELAIAPDLPVATFHTLRDLVEGG